MSQRWIAFAIAAPLTVCLLALAAFAPLPYTVYRPGPTFDVLAKDSNESEIIQVDGHETYRDDGEIRFTTVQSDSRGDKPGLFEALGAWLAGDDAVIPYDIAHPPNQTEEDERREGAASMITSQDTAIAVAMRELGYDVPSDTLQVAAVDEDGPAFKKLRVRDQFVSIDGVPIKTGDEIVDAVESHGPGDPVELVIERDDKRLTVEIEPQLTTVEGEDEKKPRLGISLGTGYDFPFEVKLRVDPSIGGPSAGLMFSLAIYDTLTPGSLTDGETIAGTGELADDGSVGPIGGIEQKIAGAEDAGAELFLVPEDNCDDIEGLDPDLTLVKATTMPQALDSLEKWAHDRDADLPSC